MKGTIISKLGQIEISSDVIAAYAGTTAVECSGIVGMAKVPMKGGGFARILKKESLTKGVSLVINGSEIELDFHVIIAYGVSIRAVADNLMENVRYKLEEFTGMKVLKIRIYVEGVRVID